MKNEKSSEGAAGSALVTIKIGKKERVFDIDNPKLPEWVEKKALESGGCPYEKKMDPDEYENTLEKLQIELVKLQAWQQATGERVLVIFEGRDAAGKGGAIDATRQYMNPRNARNVALPKPSDTERGQWYFQRYVAQFPTSGEFVIFDRSWYNRAGVEPVMGFCTPEQHARFLMEAEHFERRIVNEEIHFFKFWLDIGREMQLKRFHDRRHSLLKNWKFSPIDTAGMNKWDEYTKARDEMLDHTHSEYAPWIIIRANDKRRARIQLIRHILAKLPYAGRDLEVIGDADPKIIGEGPEFLAKPAE